MGIARGPNIVKDGLVFGYDTGYGIADNSTATRFYPGEATTNFVTTNLETLGADGSGQSSIGTRTTIAPNHVRIVDVASNTRQTHLIQGLTASTIYTVSIQFKKITGTPTFRFQLQGYSGSSYVNTIKFTSTAETGLEDIAGWQTAEWTFTLPSNCNALRIWWQDGADYATYTHSFELKNPQLEAKSHVTPYVSGTRSSTASLIDLKRTTSIDVSNVSFDSTGQPTFDGTDDYIEAPLTQTFTSALTVETWYKGTDSSRNHLWNFSGSGNLNCNFNDGSYTLWLYWDGGGSNYLRFTTPQFCDSNIHHLVFVHEGSTNKVYLDGVLLTNGVAGGTQTFNSKVGSTYNIGNSPYFQGDVYVNKVYNSSLTATQVLQNYNAYKNRFNI